MKNKRTAVAGISVLGAIGVISTGFAGWVITAPAQSDSGTGAITADGDVKTSKSVSIGTITYGDGKEDANICFAANGGTAGNGWLTSDQKMTEDLKATINVPLEFSDDVTELYFTNVSLTANGTNAAKYSELVTENVVGSLPTLQKSEPTETGKGYILVESQNVTSISIGEDGTSATASFIHNTGDNSRTFTFKVRFAWGSLFGGMNPLDYYNKEAWDSNKESVAKTNINKLSDLNNLGFTFSFTVSANKN